jgi:MerR family transcriptional regulator, thiopeptide resistance regulator
MEYSVEDVAKLAKVTVRTLHYYDEIGLLTPSIRMANGRRVYAGEQILRLMDIIFFKKLGFSLKKIESMLNLGNKDKRSLMMSRKEFLQKEIKRIKDLIKSIDSSLEFYYKGENVNYAQLIKQFELFQKNTEQDKKCFVKKFGPLEDKKMNVTEQLKYYENMMSKVDRKLYVERISSCIKKLIGAIENNQKENSTEVKDLMKEYLEILSMICPISKKKWLGIGINISEDKDLYTLYANMHPKLPEFFAKAIKIYGQNLSE